MSQGITPVLRKFSASAAAPAAGARRRAFSLPRRPARAAPARALGERDLERKALESQHQAVARTATEYELEEEAQQERAVLHAEPAVELEATEDESAPLDMATAADIAVGHTGTGASSDEVADFVHSEANYTELHDADEAEGDLAVHFEAPSDHADLTVDAYEVLADNEAADTISSVVMPDHHHQAAAEVQLPPKVVEEEVEAWVHEDREDDHQDHQEQETLGDEATQQETLDVLKKRETNLTLKQVLAFSIPALAGIMTDPLMSFVDTACVGRMSSTELAAMGPNTAVYNFVLQIFTCFIVYTCGQVSKLSSKGQHEDVFKLVSHALILGVATGVAVAAGLIGFSTPLLASMDTLPELMAPAASYLKVRALSLPAVLVCMISGAFCLGRKDSKTPLFVAIASTITNLLGDIFLIFGPPKMGITGAALATTASVYVGAAYFLWKVSSQIPLKLMIPGWREVKPFLTTSSMLTIRNMSIMFNYVAMTMFVGNYGTVASAVHQVCISIFMIGNLAAEPFSQCAQSFLASIGSMRKRSADEHKYLMGAMKLLSWTTFACGAVMAALTSGLCSIPSLFTTDAVIAAKVGFAAPIVGLAVWLSCVNCVSDGFIFASQDYNYSALMAILNVPVLLFILQTGSRMGLGWVSVWLGMAIFYALRLAENTVRIAFLNKIRLHKAKYA